MRRVASILLLLACGCAAQIRYDSRVTSTIGTSGSLQTVIAIPYATTYVCSGTYISTPCTSSTEAVYPTAADAVAGTNAIAQPLVADAYGDITNATGANGGFYYMTGPIYYTSTPPAGSPAGAGSTTVSLPGAGGNVFAQNIEQVRYADQFSAPQIQNAYNSLPAGGGTVYIAAGAYSMSAAITQVVTKPASFICDPNAILTWSGATAGFGSISGGSSVVGCHVISTNASSTFAVNGGYAQWAANTAYTAANTNVTPLTLSAARGLFFGASGSCTSGGSEPTWPVTLGGTVADGTCTWTALGYTAVTLRGDTFSGWGQQEVNTGGHNYGWIIEGNTFENGDNEGILAGGGTQSTLVEGNDFHDLGSNAIDFGGGDYNIASHNTISNVGTNSGYGIDCDGIQMAAIPGFDAVGNQAVGNYINTTGQTGIRIRGSAGQKSQYELAENNIIIAPTYDCVLFDDANTTGSNVSDAAVGNTCINPGRNGYFIPASAGDTQSNIVVSGNFSIGATSSNYDAFIGSTATNAIVANNQFLSTAPTATLDNQSASTALVGNYTPLSGGQPVIFQGPLSGVTYNGPDFTFNDGAGDTTELSAGTSRCGSLTQWCIQPPGGKIFTFDGTSGNMAVPGTLEAASLEQGSQAVVLSGVNGLSAGTITISSAVSGSHTFTTAYTAAPACTASESGTSPTALTYGVSSSTTAVTVTLSTSGSGTFTFMCAPPNN